MSDSESPQRPSNIQDLTGRTFGKLCVVSYCGRGKHRTTLWRCRCVCGNNSVVTGENLRLKNGLGVRSCGCSKKSRTPSLNPEYTTWRSMRQRVLNPKSSSYANYGARGITICERWMKFENFLSDMGKKPSPGMSLERINNDAGYEPENCKWDTQKKQTRNMRCNHILTFNGESKSMVEWAEERNLPYKTLHSRIWRGGWSPQRAITTPCKPCGV